MNPACCKRWYVLPRQDNPIPKLWPLSKFYASFCPGAFNQSPSYVRMSCLGKFMATLIGVSRTEKAINWYFYPSLGCDWRKLNKWRPKSILNYFITWLWPLEATLWNNSHFHVTVPSIEDHKNMVLLFENEVHKFSLTGEYFGNMYTSDKVCSGSETGRPPPHFNFLHVQCGLIHVKCIQS